MIYLRTQWFWNWQLWYFVGYWSSWWRCYWYHTYIHFTEM